MPGSWGGFRPGAGRPKGSSRSALNRALALHDTDEELKQAIKEMGDPLLYLKGVVAGRIRPEPAKMEAAALVLPYCYGKKIQVLEQNAAEGVTFTLNLKPLKAPGPPTFDAEPIEQYEPTDDDGGEQCD